MRFPDFIS
jgi:hypothetical protein